MRLSKDLKICYLYGDKYFVNNGNLLSYKGVLFSAFSKTEFRVMYLNSKNQRCFLYFTFLPNNVIQTTQGECIAKTSVDFTIGMAFDAVIEHIKRKGYNRFLGKGSKIVEI